MKRAPKVFVSYRRRDVSGYAGRITDALAAELGAANVFQDVATVAPGVDFRTQVDRSLAAADALLVIIGPGWLDATSADGRRRLFEPDDLVRTEVARALEADLRVVPVLVGGAGLPPAADLPPDLQDLASRQAVTVRDETFHQDVARLVRSLRAEPGSSAEDGWRPRRVLVATAAAIAVVLVAGGAWWAWKDRDGEGGGTAKPRCPDPRSGPGWHDIAVDPHRTADLAHESGGSLVFAVNAARWRAQENGRWLVVLSTQMLNDTKGEHAHAAYYYEALEVARRPFDPYCFDPPANDAAAQQVVDAHVGFIVTCRPEGQLSIRLQNTPIDAQVLPFTTAATPAECAS